MTQQIGDRFAKSRVRLRLAPGKLPFQPAVQLVHPRTTALLMELEPLVRRHGAVTRFGVVGINFTQPLQHVTALDRKVRRHIDELPSSVSQAQGEQYLRASRQLRHVARERVTHLNRCGLIGRALFHHVSQILSGMLTSGEEQGDLPVFVSGNNAAGKHTGALVAFLAFELQHTHARIVVVQNLALRRLADQFIAGWPDQFGGFFDDLPLRRRRQRNAQ